MSQLLKVRKGLKVTKGLVALELFSEGTGPRTSAASEAAYRSDDTTCCSSVVSNLDSFDTLRHVRLFGMEPDQRNPVSTDYSRFNKLRVLTADDNFLAPVEIEHRQSPIDKRIRLPSSIDSLVLPFHGRGDVIDPAGELLLVKILKTKLLPNLRTVIVPSKIIDLSGIEFGSPLQRSDWREGRKQLARLETGRRRFRLKVAEFGDYGE